VKKPKLFRLNLGLELPVRGRRAGKDEGYNTIFRRDCKELDKPYQMAREEIIVEEEQK